MDTSPLCTGVSVVSTRTTVVLPAPLGPSRPSVSPAVHLQGQIVDGGEVAVAVGEVLGSRSRGVVTVASRSAAGHLGEDLQSRGQAVGFVVVELVEHGGQRGAAGGAGFVGDVLRRLGQSQPADAAVVGVDVRGAAARRPTAWTPAWTRCWAPGRVRRRPGCTEMSGWRPTRRNSSACDSVSPAPSNPRPADRRS